MKPYTMEDYADEANKLPWMIDADRLKATILALEEARAALSDVAERQRQACAEAALAWSRGQVEVAEDKERDSVMASAEMHMEESIMARRIAAAIRRGPLVTEE